MEENLPGVLSSHKNENLNGCLWKQRTHKRTKIGKICFVKSLPIQQGCIPLRKHAYSNILEILLPKNENFQRKKSYICHISAQNIDCGYSLEPPRQSMFLSRKKKTNVYPCKPQFYYIKVGFKGVKII